MDELRLDFNPDRLTLDMLIELDDIQNDTAGGLSQIRPLRNFLAGFVVDAAGQGVDEATARALVGRMTLAQLRETMDGVGASVGASKSAAVSGEASGS